jgi:hypothetical protein
MKTKEEIINTIAHISQKIDENTSVYFQELVYDEEGNPIDWDEQATRIAYDNYLASK